MSAVWCGSSTSWATTTPATEGLFSIWASAVHSCYDSEWYSEYNHNELASNLIFYILSVVCLFIVI